MADMGETIYGRLGATTGVTGILGSTKIYPVVLPQKATLPAVTYAQITGVRHHAAGKDPSLTSPTWQVSAWSTDYKQVKTLSREVRLALQDYSGTTWANVQRIFLENEIDFTEVDEQTREVTYHTAQDFICWYSTET